MKVLGIWLSYGVLAAVLLLFGTVNPAYSISVVVASALCALFTVEITKY